MTLVRSLDDVFQHSRVLLTCLRHITRNRPAFLLPDLVLWQLLNLARLGILGLVEIPNLAPCGTPYLMNSQSFKEKFICCR
jgi:hypothetical protein